LTDFLTHKLAKMSQADPVNSLVVFLENNMREALKQKVLAFAVLLSEMTESGDEGKGPKFSAEDVIGLWNKTTEYQIDPVLIPKGSSATVRSSVASVASSAPSVSHPPTSDKCQYEFKKGASIGTLCGKKAKVGDFCTAHSKGAAGSSGVASPASGVASPPAGAPAGGDREAAIRAAANITALKAIAKDMKFPKYTTYTKDRVEELREALLAKI